MDRSRIAEEVHVRGRIQVNGPEWRLNRGGERRILAFPETIGREKSLFLRGGEIAATAPLFPASTLTVQPRRESGRRASLSPSSSSFRNLVVIAFSAVPSVLSPTRIPLNLPFFSPLPSLFLFSSLPLRRESEKLVFRVVSNLENSLFLLSLSLCLSFISRILWKIFDSSLFYPSINEEDVIS